MVSIRKTLKCSCGTYMNFTFEADMPIEDLTVSGKCPSCGKTVQISVVSMEGGSAAAGGSVQITGTVSEALTEEGKGTETLELDNADYESVSNENVESALNEMFNQ
ncbi:hypothetical protein COV61_02830 [Candidatus Micrarchaeota archaeon CG11_big_fil_rev_8_21_14_0_20_47_5]|nr:MAG: hypothetical protein AUJ17_05360 [Candidatus Micrarchaeota archaeon CG1_02_47_40]PIN83541.1 MAG: hypothetical protein COV61_02830 [Candidatus Micrarchaeota archaeon CG11_big_fil_rev_8_21_14_0_20_47_5]